MIVTTVMVQVDPQHIHDFIEACTRNHEASVNEPGNRRFDILQSDNDPCRFMLYEAYDDVSCATAHKMTDHYRIWKETVAPWMAEPRQAFHYTAIRP